MVWFSCRSINGRMALHLQLERGQANVLLTPDPLWSVHGRLDHCPIVLVVEPDRALVGMRRRTCIKGVKMVQCDCLLLSVL